MRKRLQIKKGEDWRSRVRHLYKELRSYWFLVLWCCLGGGLAAWALLVVSPQDFELTTGVPSYPFSILCGSVATLCGVLLGLIIASRAFMGQRSSSAKYANRDLLLREREWLHSWLRTKKSIGNGTSEKLRELCTQCELAATITVQRWESGEHKRTVSSVISALEKMTSGIEKKMKRISKEQKKLERHGEQDAESYARLGQELEQAEKELDELDDLAHHTNVISMSLRRLEANFLYYRIEGLLTELSYTVGATLMTALVFLILSGFERFGAPTLSNYHRLYLGVFLIWMFLPSLQFLFRTIGLHSKLSRLA